MSEFTREALPIFFMYGCVLALGPFIGVAMWLAFDGDRLREVEAETVEQHVEVREHDGVTVQRTTEVTTAA